MAVSRSTILAAASMRIRKILDDEDAHPGDNLLLETGDNLLLENDVDALLLD